MWDSFIAGSAYGATSVLVGQPFDTIKTKMQAAAATSTSTTIAKKSNLSSFAIGKNIILTDGILGLYRGGLPLLLGGSFIRSAQFFVNDISKNLIKNYKEKHNIIKPIQYGVFNFEIIISGAFGGIARGLIESPIEFVKTRNQLAKSYKIREVFNGSKATLIRNTFLFSFFMTYIDISQQLFPGLLSPFWSGAICSNLAWLTIWPLDVIKSQRQSGNFNGYSMLDLFKYNIKSGSYFKGIVPGLLRSFFANGCSMVVYNMILEKFKEDRKKNSVKQD